LRIFIRVLVVALLAAVAALALLAFLLFRPNDREPGLLVEALSIRAGDRIGEIGAGDGWLSVEVAKRVGPSGHVYSTELDADRLDEIRAAAREAGLSNITAIEAAERSTKLMPACCDAVFMRRVFHHLSDPAAIVADLEDTLRPGGRLAVIEFESSGLLGTVTREGIDRNDLIGRVTRGGFELITVEEWPGLDHYVAVFRKSAP
jgi:ubiquinone/menaquinone biosynthesis C-methylase UbiE